MGAIDADGPLSQVVVPAKAGTERKRRAPRPWIPARVRMTGEGKRSPRRLGSLILGSAVLLASCTGRIWQDEVSADTVRLHWYTAEASIDDARSLAEEHCRRSDRRAEMVQEFEDGDITTAGFVCEPRRP
jgi:hypothetical protein